MRYTVTITYALDGRYPSIFSDDFGIEAENGDMAIADACEELRHKVSILLRGDSFDILGIEVDREAQGDDQS